MMPMKNASSDMKSAASPRKETTRLSALATGLRLMITAAPKISIKAEAIQKKKGDILVRAWRFLKTVIPSRADGEGPRRPAPAFPFSSNAEQRLRDPSLRSG